MFLVPERADACRGSFIQMYNDLHEEKEQMEEIEEGIKEGHLRRSFLEARRLEHRIRRLRRYGFSIPAAAMRSLRRRIAFVRAVATVRLDGRVDDARDDKDRRVANLEGALATLQQAHEADPTSLTEARLAEAKSKFEDQREEAAQMLQSLADRDVMPDTYSYRTLALLQSSLGNQEQAAAASRACILSASMREQPLCPVLT